MASRKAGDAGTVYNVGKESREYVDREGTKKRRSDGERNRDLRLVPDNLTRMNPSKSEDPLSPGPENVRGLNEEFNLQSKEVGSLVLSLGLAFLDRLCHSSLRLSDAFFQVRFGCWANAKVRRWTVASFVSFSFHSRPSFPSFPT